MTVENFPDREISIDGKTYLYFGGTSYLGMATNVNFQKLVFNSFKKWGTSYGSSRASNIKLSVFNEAETSLSQFIGAESSLTVSSGMLAGKLVISHLQSKNQIFYHYPKTHPAILAPNSLPLFINNQLNPKLQNDNKEEIAITVDAILSLEVSTTNFDFLNVISNNKKITLVVDESHTLGIVGKYGEGIFSTINNTKIDRKIMVSSLGKALGLSAGVIASDNNFIEELKNESIFVTSSPANPAYLETFLQAGNLYKLQLHKLRSNLEILDSILIKSKNFSFNKNYPVIYSENSEVSDLLLENGIINARFKYPTYKNEMNRIVITSNHTKKDLEKLALLLNSAK